VVNIKSNILFRHLINTRLLILLALIASVFVFFPTAKPVQADSISELQEKSNQLQAEISANNQIIADLEEKSEDLQSKLSQLNAEITQANNQIELTSIKLEELALRLEKTKAELERQKQLLKSALRALYQRKDASTVELLMASESFSDFISTQEYLERLQNAVKDSTDQVINLKLQIEAEKKTQEELLAKQEEQRNVLAAKRSEQQTLLDQTQGEQSRYEAIVQNQLKELQEAEDQLTALLAQGSYVNYGPIGRGEVVGLMGSTGFSTGPHLHFQVKQNGTSQNPRSGGNNLINGFSWPLPGSGWGNVSQEYGCVAPYNWYYTKCGNSKSFHSGLDIAGWYGDLVVAAADGDVIYKGCNGGYGYTVVIDHGGGWQTWYPHLKTPSGQSSGYC
jgi:murein DD-endopeptidase MepM/ murein hydrolase activator NlpD